MNVQLGNPDTSRARARWWGPDGDVLQVVLTDQHTVPEPDELAEWIDAARRAGASTVRTGALFPAAAARFADGGFGVIDTLALLAIDLEQPALTPTAAASTATAGRLGPLRRRHDPAAADIDRRAFGTPWANDIDKLDEIRRATPIHRARGIFASGGGLRWRPLLAFAIAGAAAGQGYLQRLAVDPAHQGQGHGRALTQDALAWMRRRRLHQGFVNTAVTNEAPLALHLGRVPDPRRSTRRHGTVGQLMRRRILAAGVLIALTVGIVAPAAAPATATEPDAPAPPEPGPAPETGTLTLLAQEYALDPGEAWTAQFSLADPEGAIVGAVTDAASAGVGGRVFVRVHGPIESRDELARILEGDVPTITDGVTLALTDTLHIDPDGTPLLEITAPTDTEVGPGALTLAQPGFYPISVTVQIDGVASTSHLSFVRRLSARPDTGTPLGLAVLARIADIGPLPTSDEIVEQRRELERLAAYGDITDAPLTLALPPGVESVLDGDELLRAGLAGALTNTELISLPLLPIDPSAAAAADQMDRFASEVRLGEDTLARLFPGVEIRRSAWVIEDELSGPAAAELRDPLGYRLLVMNHATYDELPGSINGYLDTQRLIAASPGPGQQDLPAIVINPAGTRLGAGGGGGGPVDDAVTLLTQLLVARDEIGADDRRTAVLGADDLALPDPTTVDALAVIVDDQPDVEMVHVSEVASRTDPMRVDGDITRVELPAVAGPDLSERLERIELARVAAESAASMLPTLTERDRWQRELDTLTSTEVSAQDVDATLARVASEVDAVLASVEAPEPFEFTLTGRQSPLRLNVRNLSGEPRTVLIRPSSAKLEFPGGEQLVTLQPGVNEVVIPVEARSNGTASVGIELVTPVFSRPLAPPTVLTARVNALTGLGPMVTGVAVLLLGSWWYSHYRRRRRQHLADATPVDGIAFDAPVSPDAAEATVAPPGPRDDTASLTDL